MNAANNLIGLGVTLLKMGVTVLLTLILWTIMWGNAPIGFKCYMSDVWSMSLFGDGKMTGCHD